MNAVLEQIDARARGRQAAKATLVQRLSRDENVPIEEIETICEEAGTTPHKVFGEAEVLKQRQAQRDETKKRPALEARIAETVKEETAEKLLFEAAQQRWFNAVHSLSAERNQLSAESGRLSMLPDQLARTCPDKSLVARFDHAVAMGRQFDQQIFHAKSNAQRILTAHEEACRRNSPEQYKGAFERTQKAVADLQGQQSKWLIERDAVWKLRSEF